ncbi:MAG: antibiotic biosynthesis monooxygenase [Hyphomicrobiales bacterium]|nr:antibiotic biosynthesis monooxygenase [Hyphomicrobiales bacterium]
MELYIFARFRVREGQELPAAKVLAEQVGAARSEPGCLAIGAFRSTRDPLLFFIHSRWVDDAAFEVHAELPRTTRFVEIMEGMIDHPFEATRTHAL